MLINTLGLLIEVHILNSMLVQLLKYCIYGVCGNLPLLES